MTSSPATGTGAPSFLAHGLETTAGTPVSRSNFLMYESNAIAPKSDIIKKSIAGGVRTAQRVVRPAKYKLGGAVGWDAMAHQGLAFYRGALGKYIPLSAVTDALPASGATNIQTTGNITTITLNTGTGFSVGALVTIDTGASQEIRQIQSFNSGPKTITVSALSLTHAQTSTAVVQPAQHKFVPYAPTDSQRFTLPSYTLESNESSLWGWVLPGSFVDKLSFKASKDVIGITSDFICSARPQRAGGNASASQPSPLSLTAFAPSAAESADPPSLFTITDGSLAISSDPLATGSSAFQLMPYIENWELDWANAGVQKAWWDGSPIYKYAAPGVATGSLKYTYSNYALRPAEFEDYIDTLIVSQPSWQAYAAHNVGTSGSPTWYGTAWYAPTTTITDTPIKRSLTDVQSVDVTAEIVYESQDALSIFCLNSITPASGAY